MVMSKKIIAIFLVFIMSLSLLTGCGGNKKDKNEVTATDSETAANDSNNTANEASGAASDGSSWEIDKTPITLEWFMAYDWASYTFDPVKNLFDKYLLEETGVTINWTYGSVEKLNMLIATNQLPDIITFDMVSNERLVMEDNGLLAPLDELKDKYAPDFDAVQSMQDWYRNDDGHWYAFSSYYYGAERTTPEFGGYLATHNKNFARNDIMEALGIDPASLNTKEGILTALRTVKDANYQYNGKTVQPFFGYSDQYYAEQLGADREDKDGNFINIIKTPEYKEAILFYNQLYLEGFLSDEEFTIDPEMRKQKIANGEVFFGTAVPNIHGSEILEGTDPNAWYRLVGHCKGDEGKQGYLTPSPTGGWTGTMISKNCKYPERAVRLFSFLSQPEMSLYSATGGYEYFDIIDGHIVLRPEEVEAKNADNAAWTTVHNAQAAAWFTDWTYYMKYEPLPDTSKPSHVNIEVDKSYSDLCIDDKIFSNVIPESGTDLAMIRSTTDEYWRQQVPQIIMASSQEQCAQMLADTLAKMDEMGLKKLDEFKNGRFQENKEKMGVKFAWPRNLQ